MNYTFQMRGILEAQESIDFPLATSIDPTVRFDYSGTSLPVLGYLDENNLDETVGIQAGSSVMTLYYCNSFHPFKAECVGPSMVGFGDRSIDWSCNGSNGDSGVDADINGDGFQNKLSGHNDWAVLQYAFQGGDDFDDGVHANVTPPEEELGYQDVLQGALDNPIVLMAVDVKPDSEDNVINLKSKGVVPVAILSSLEFDARSVIVETVSFAGSSDIKHQGHLEDINGDGILDLLLHFNTQSLLLDPNSTIGVVTGKTTDRQLIYGEDHVLINQAKKN